MLHGDIYLVVFLMYFLLSFIHFRVLTTNENIIYACQVKSSTISDQIHAGSWALPQVSFLGIHKEHAPIGHF